MAEGGTIPTNRTQSVTFYNTTGLIEKEKGIYLSPRFRTHNDEDYSREVRRFYLDVLNAQAVKDPDYTNIEISSWSPQDRTLTVRGNIDDFRLVTDEGDCLNYLVVTRNVTKGNVTNTYYYGFFITEVVQAGGSSIRLTVEPDDFTNIFFLHNRHALTVYEVETSDYDPFNERMKNCYVQRQHYNRVFKSLSGYWILSLRLTNLNMSQGTIQVGDNVTIEFEDQNETVVSGEVEYIDDRDVESDHTLYIEIKTASKSDIGEPLNFSELIHEQVTRQCDYDYDSIEWEHIAPVYPINKHIFLNQEESFKFKYQYRDKKIPFSHAELFTDAELTRINNVDNFNNLSRPLQVKILKASIQYLVVETKSMEKTGKGFIYIRNQEPSPYSSYKINFRNYVAGLARSSEVLIAPLFNVPEILKKYESAITAFSFEYVLSGTVISVAGKSGTDIYTYLNSNSLADFILSAYVVNDVGMPDSVINFDMTQHKVYYRVITGFGTHTNKELFLVGVDSNNTSASGYTQNEGINYIYNTLEDYLSDSPAVISPSSYGFVMLMLSGYNGRDISINIPEDDVSNIKNQYYDPVLEAEPYSFYSLSYLAYEMPFNKNRYYETMTVKFSYIVSVNGAVKLSYIPSYTVEGIETKYFNEGLVFTLSSSLPLMSDSFASYYYQNQAQMKNQFAVNDYNRGVDLAQHFFLSGPNAVGQQAFKHGWQGAVAETVNQFAQMADEAIDWAQSNKVIDMNQKAKLADMGARPDVVKQAGSDIFSDLETKENRPFLNHYRIDDMSYNSIAKFLERFGYQISLYTSMNVNDRIGWNYIKLISFDWNPAFDIMVGQEENLRKIFSKGVTLLHNKSYLTSGHNYETILDE